MKLLKFTAFSAASIAYLIAPTQHANAAMGNIGSTYGVLPADIATAQALSLFNPQVSSVYYNPANLVRKPGGELTTGLLHAEHEIKLKSLGGSDPANRTGSNVIENSPSQHVLLGMKTDLTSLTQFEHPVYLGMMLGVEKYGKEMLAFDSHTGNDGQSFEYGRQPLFLVLGGGTNIWRGIDAGFSARIALHSAATLNASSSLSGATTQEQMSVSAKPVISPIVGVNIDWGKTLCAESTDGCFLDKFQTAISYRALSNTKTTVNSNITIPGTVPSPGVALAVTTLDSYQPDILSVGMMYGSEKDYLIGVTLEMQQWSKLEDELAKDTIKDQAITTSNGQLTFRNTVTPRVGGEYWFNKNLMLSAGVAFSKSPLDSNSSLNVNYLDSDKLIMAVGLSFDYDEVKFLSKPVRLDVGYQHHELKERKFDLYSSSSPSYPQPYERVATSGSVDVFSASVTLKF